MIITKLIGGLGNQMFQYAIARSLSVIKQTDFKMDISGFELIKPPYTPRRYELNNFNIIENFADSKEIQRFNGKKAHLSIFLGKIFPILQNYTYHYYGEKQFNYNPDVFKLKGNIYLDGYWQTEKYFKNIEDVIRRDFTVKTEPDEKNKDLLNKIKNCNGVAVHVRRGDYAEVPLTSSIHGICGLDYYKKSVDLIAEKADKPHFFVFSDDMEWTKENLKIDFPVTYLSHNRPDKGHEDLRLMSNCRHFIIANSSFSWWGAWLSNNPDKIVLAPERWFKKEGMDTNDLIPDGWMRVS
ncbi:MAG: alpha-1,2-fucosyltransferase [Euryarchaeota archaeon HGW-Euryarchaeota-1]|nr:MAG: alpha-1,2-fucosyltransferase [Euryarchaeota archaeon HGW-Euryarchaeota-1]